MKTELKLGFAGFVRGEFLLPHLVEHDVGDLVGHVRPDVDDLVVALAFRDNAVLGLLLDLA